MTDNHEPAIALQPEFSSDNAAPTPWAQASDSLEKARIYWLSTVRPDGRPHVTPLFAVWLEGAIYFCTGPEERKAKNLAGNRQCVVTTGCNVIEGVDVVVEGDAVRVSDDATLQAVAGLFDSKYDWQYEVREGALYGKGGRAELYRVVPARALGFGKGETFSQTRWRF